MEMFVRSILLMSLRWDTRSRNSSRRWEEGEYQVTIQCVSNANEHLVLLYSGNVPYPILKRRILGWD